MLLHLSGRLRTSRKAAGLTQAELARRARVSRASVQRWERFGDLPSARAARVLGDALNVSAQFLLGLEEVRRPGVVEVRLLELYQQLRAANQASLVAIAEDLVRVEQIATAAVAARPKESSRRGLPGGDATA
jgi:transcriptional regulator with XRE-family HTH domain